jgi:hypothetical protein
MKLNVKEWRTRDREQSNPNERQRLPLPAEGEWNSEPDKIQWVDEATGLDCLMHRGPGGFWCGYVGVAEGHPAFGKDYDSVGVEVHGGLTYADFCQDTGDESHGICHVPERRATAPRVVARLRLRALRRSLPSPPKPAGNGGDSRSLSARSRHL